MTRVRIQLGAAIVAAIVLAVVIASAYAGGGAKASSQGSASIGALRIRDAKLVEPASPDQAVIYLTVRNTGNTDDELIGVTSSIAGAGMLMREETQGLATQMLPVQDIAVPAHSTATLKVGGFHAMLVNLNSVPHRGETVPVTLRFARAGEVTLRVPVVTYEQLEQSNSGP